MVVRLEAQSIYRRSLPYDYDAPLDEQGNPTAKYYALQKMLKEHFPEYEQHEPRSKNISINGTSTTR